MTDETASRYGQRGYGLGERPCEVLMDDGTWEPGVVLQDTTTCHGHAALITCVGITGWFYREGGKGHVNEWRYGDSEGEAA